MKNRPLQLLFLCVTALALLATGCTTSERQRRASVLEYLYPEGKEAQEATDVHLQLPLSIGLAFVPEADAYTSTLLPSRQQALLERIVKAFDEVGEFDRIEIIPSSFVSPGGGFENVDQIRRTLGIDLVVLVSFDQTQFDDPKLSSLTYWTIVGAYVVEGNKNETHTFVHASAFDIESRALLMNASGQSQVEGSATGVDIERSLREDRAKGFDMAVEDLIVNLGGALTQFREQVKSGSIRGRGTPAVKVTSTVTGGFGGGGGTGVGGLGLLELALGGLLVVAARRRVHRA